MATNPTAHNQAIVLYIPVLHQGYLNLLTKYPEAELAVVDKKFLEGEFKSILKDIRALSTELILQQLKSLFPDRVLIHLQAEADLAQLADYQELIMAEDEISDWLEKNLVAKVTTAPKITHDSIFLRWSLAKTKQQQDINPDGEVTRDELHQQFMGSAVAASQRSADWWRQTGAAIAKDGQLLVSAGNRHAPSDQQQYFLGDPRANYSRGADIEMSTSLHAEGAVIAHAAAQGISLRGADLYVTTFPCPYCARIIAYSGIKRLFYKDGYSVLDGEGLLRASGIEIIRVAE